MACALLLSSTAHAGIQVPPITTLPSVPSAPRLWFDGSDASVIAALKSRMTHPRTAALFNGFRAFVEGRLGNIGSADDDTRARFVKAAGLLHVLGLTPPANTVASYRAAVVTAFVGVRDREAIDSIGEYLSPPANAINVLQDAPRLQSLAEGYDFLRGSGLNSDELGKMQVVLASWANAMAHDWNLTGALGVPGHRDNWGIKGGAALVTVALAMPEHADADEWLETGMAFVNESLDIVASPTGWYAESPWYLNYSLNNLAPAAWHAKNVANKDWFASLRPFVTGSLAWRQPDGTAPPFEEGITNTFPWNTLAGAYPDLTSTMLWAWDNSPRNTENFENQAYHDVTRFLVLDLETAPAPPTLPVTRTLPNDTHLVALRAGWGGNDLQVTSITARDHATTELITSRHNVRNPLDVVVHGAGYLAMPTASGGPTVTTSANRASYLDVRAKNIPLVNGQAPFVVAASNVVLDARLDSEDEGQRPNHYADMARTTLTQVYADTREVSRLVAMIDRGYVVVLDRFAANTSRNFQLSWRGRGARTNRADTATAKGFSWAGNGVRLDVDVVGAGLTTAANQSFYAPAWNQEETINGVLVGTNGANAAFVTVIQVGVAAARSVTAIGSGANVVSGNTTDTIVFGGSADGVAVDGYAAIVRREGGAVAALAMAAATRLEVGALRVEATTATTLSLTPSTGGFAMEVAPDASGTLTIVGVPSIDAALAYRAFREGQPVALVKTGATLTLANIGGGTYVVEAVPCTAGDGPDGDGDLVCGASDNCPNVANEAQTDSDGDLIGDACECVDVARCDDQDPCTSDGCNPATGACTHGPAAGVCDDGSVCTSGDHCESGACVGTAVPCDDGNACTTDSCDALLGCRFVGRAGACDDGNACTTSDTCAASQCAGTAIVCDDGNACTADSCDALVGCVAIPSVGPCDDQDRCTRDDACAAGACLGAAVVCDDGNACTDEACDVALGCVATAGHEGEGCDDANSCTSNDRCQSGACRGDGLQCDDGNPCTVDTCALGAGCTNIVADDGGACDDADPCTDIDVCAAGVCRGASVVCDDDDPCTTDACLDGACVATPLTCADDEVCIDGDCVVSAPDSEPTEPTEAGPEADPEAIEANPEAIEANPEAYPEADPEAIEANPEGIDVVEATPDPAPDAEPTDAITEADGLGFSDTGPQVIGGKDDGCSGGPSSIVGLLLAMFGRRRRESRSRR